LPCAKNDLVRLTAAACKRPSHRYSKPWTTPRLETPS
jgi:hypothetical protein